MCEFILFILFFREIRDKSRDKGGLREGEEEEEERERGRTEEGAALTEVDIGEEEGA